MKGVSAMKWVLFVVWLSSCNQIQKEKQKVVSTELKKVEKSFVIPQTWINKRVLKTKEKLVNTDAGKVLWQGMNAHGGLRNWFSNGVLSFRFNYQPLAKDKTGRDSYQVIDIWSNRAVHSSPQNSNDKYGWDGNTAWIKAKDSTTFKYDTKFWALTPLYLFGYPFVLDGEGVNLELLPEVTYKGKMNDVVKATFDPGTGDAPDDYYILQFDKETHLITAIRYIVSYPAYFKDGGHNPEKFMEVGQLKEVNGVLLPTSLKTHWSTKTGQPGEYVTKIEITDLEFTKEVSNDFFDVPEGAIILE